jgi:hypothetical protein
MSDEVAVVAGVGVVLCFHSNRPREKREDSTQVSTVVRPEHYVDCELVVLCLPRVPSAGGLAGVRPMAEI